MGAKRRGSLLQYNIFLNFFLFLTFAKIFVIFNYGWVSFSKMVEKMIVFLLFWNFNYERIFVFIKVERLKIKKFILLYFYFNEKICK